MTNKRNPVSSVAASLPDFVPFALQSAGVGTWEHNLIKKSISYDAVCQELYGLAEPIEVPYLQFLSHVHPDDRSVIERTREWAMDTRSGGKYDCRFRTISADTGQLRWVRCQGKAYFSVSGKAFRIVGIAQDITQDMTLNTDRSSHQLTAVLATVGVYRLGLLTDELIHTGAFAHLIVGDANAVLSRADFIRALHPQDELLRQIALEEAARTGVYAFEPRFVWPDGSVHQTRLVGVMHRDESGRPSYIVGHVDAIKERTPVAADNRLRFQALVSASPVAMALFHGEELVVETANAAMYQLLNVGREVIGKPLTIALPEWLDQPFVTLLRQACVTGEAIVSPSQLVTSWVDNQLVNRHYTYYYTPLWDEQQQVYAVLATALDISEQVSAKRKLEVSEARFRSIIEQAPMAITLLRGRSMVLEMANDKVYEIWNTNESILDRSLIETIPDILDQGFLKLLESVFDTGKPFFGHDMQVNINRKGISRTAYFDLAYMPLRDTSGAITGILSMATNVTDRVLARKATEASENKLAAVLNTAPIAMGLYVGPDMVVEMANKTYIDILGKGPDVIGKPLRLLMPELERQPNLKTISAVYASGEPVKRFGASVDIVRNGVLTHNRFNISYSPMRDAAGLVYGVLSIGIDVTEEVRDRKILEESEQHYRHLAESLARQLSPKN